MSQESWYERNVLPYVIDMACGIPAISRQRQQVVPMARGDVLEIGLGTGRNIPYYDPTKVSRIVGVDPALRMHTLARKRVKRSGVTVDLMGLSAEKLPTDDATFDTVVCTFTLCTIPDPAAALAEMRRVLKPECLLLCAEHGRAPDPGVAHWQERLQPLWGKLAGGCHLGRDIPGLLKAAQFRLELHEGYVDGPRFASYHYWGQARAR